ncbi:hypothetical protein [Streptomyces sp. NPDC012888]|uniref:hypothetical protein n=1 Tax=Streptomyces sp. NPDC012888 TaxID=3364855 RepID=UPI003697FEB2
MPDTDTLRPGDELDEGTPVICCGDVMDTVGTTWTCPVCATTIQTRDGLIFDIRD